MDTTMSGKNSGIPDHGAPSDSGREHTEKEPMEEMNDDPKLDPRAQELIGRQLKVLYGSILDEPVPDQFVKLLEDLERKERGA